MCNREVQRKSADWLSIYQSNAMVARERGETRECVKENVSEKECRSTVYVSNQSNSGKRKRRDASL